MRSRPQRKRLRDFRLVLLGVERSEALAARRESNLCIGREEDVDPSLQGRCNLDGVRLVEMMLAEEIPSTSNQFHAEGDFFFQAEAGIRSRDVTGVQTCALPI